MKFKKGDIIVLQEGMAAKKGSEAVVIDPRRNDGYVQIEWINREKFDNHGQQNGGYFESSFELKNEAIFPSKGWCKNPSIDLVRYINSKFDRGYHQVTLSETKENGNICWSRTSGTWTVKHGSDNPLYTNEELESIINNKSKKNEVSTKVEKPRAERREGVRISGQTVKLASSSRPIGSKSTNLRKRVRAKQSKISSKRLQFDSSSGSNCSSKRSEKDPW